MAAIAGIPYVFFFVLFWACQMRCIVGMHYVTAPQIVHLTVAAEEACTVIQQTQLFCKLFSCY